MKLIAHRGASLEAQENTAESLNLGSALGAYAVECDITLSGDGEFVFYHDLSMERLTGDRRLIRETPLEEIRRVHREAGLKFYTAEEMFAAYTGKAYILLDTDPDAVADPRFNTLIRKWGPERFIFGAHCLRDLEIAGPLFPSDRILSFNQEPNEYREMFEAGAGIIRLWENWLSFVTPADVKKNCPGAKVWIMSNQPALGLNGSEMSLLREAEMGADGVLLNNIRMGADLLRSCPELAG